MQTILVSKPRSDSLKEQLVSLYQTFSKIDKLKRVTFNLSQLDWVYPLLILPISAYIHETESKYLLSQNEKVNTSLNTIGFPRGISSISKFLKESNYLPITFLKKTKSVGSRERIESSFSQLIYKAIGEIAGARNAIYYPISEIVTNIFEHSGKKEGWMFAQIYPKKKFLDLCIVDTGRGLKSCYEEEKGIVLDNSQALKKATSGYSTQKSEERGYGIYSSRRVICEALGGSFIILSGNAALIAQHDKENLIRMPGFSWRGVIVSYRVPFPQKAVDIYPFLE